MPKFDFSNFFGQTAKREVECLGLTEVQTKEILAQEHGLSKTLMHHYPDLTKYANGPNSAMKALIVWEANGRDCTYEVIAEGLGVKLQTAYLAMCTARKMAESALLQRIEHDGDKIYLVSQESVALKCERVDLKIQTVTKVLDNLSSDVKSLKQGGSIVSLPGRVEKYLSAHEECLLLEEAS